MGAVLALASSLLWGCSDFTGGTLSRRRPAIAVVAWADILILLVLVPAVFIQGDARVTVGLICWGGAAGLAGMAGLLGYYKAMASGPMGVVAPIAGLGVMVPVIVGIGMGDRPDVAQYLGILVAIVGVVFVSTQGSARTGASLQAVVLALGGALGFGACFVFIDESEQYGTLMTLIAMRVATLIVVAIGVAVTRRRLSIESADLPLLIVVGVFDAAANACFARATVVGELTVVSVLSSIYPVVTALLARVVHDERLVRRQLAGVAVTMAAIVLLAAGPGA